MIKYIIKRLIICCVIFFVAMFAIYTIMYMLPESYAESIARELSHLSNNEISVAEWQLRIESECGLNNGLFEGYIKWLSGAFSGDFGTSWYYSVPVVDKFCSVIENSVLICLSSFILEILIAIPMGIISASRSDSNFDRITLVLCAVCTSVPVFFIAAFLKYLFAIKLGMFEIGGLKSNSYIYMTDFERVSDKLSHLVLPISTLVIAGSGTLVRYTRTNVNMVMDSKYVKGAKARGLSKKNVLLSHSLRNSMVPIINIICSAFPTVFAGSMIIETVFSIEGIGYVSYMAMEKGDIPFTMFYMMIITLVTIMSSFASDIICAACDYRIRSDLYGGGKQ